MSPAALYRRFHAHPLAGIGFYLGAMLCFSVMNTLIRDVTIQAPSLLIVFLRNLFSLLIVLPIVLVKRRHVAPSERLWLHFWRAAVGLFAMETWFFSLSLMPVSQATALSFTTPLFAALFAVAFLGETIGLWRIAALLTGFAGTMVILRPWEAGELSGSVAVVLFSASMMALASILVKRLAATEPAWRVVFYMSGFMALLSAPMGLAAWQALTPRLYAETFAIAFFSTMAQMAMVAAFFRASVVVLMPFDFARLVFTALLAVLLLGEAVSVHTLLGAALIVSSSALIAWREARHRRPVSPPSTEG